MDPLNLDPKTTALVLIDLQHGIKARNPVPHGFNDVVARSAAIGDKLRTAGGTVVYVNVNVSDMQAHVTDRVMRSPNDPPPPAIMSELVPECGIQPGDLTITKRSWGAFLQTTLDEQLRAKGVTTVIMAGVATNIGVESTARSAYDLGYDLVFAEDAMSTLSQEMHDYTIKVTFPMMGRVRSTAEIVEALS